MGMFFAILFFCIFLVFDVYITILWRRAINRWRMRALEAEARAEHLWMIIKAEQDLKKPAGVVDPGTFNSTNPFTDPAPHLRFVTPETDPHF